jgi:hypothetical protein
MDYRAIAPGVVAVLGLGFGAASAQAEGLRVKDGLWETTMKSPMTGERTSRECLKDTMLDPQSMLEGQSECQMTEHTLQGNTLTFTMTCAGGSGTAHGRMSVDGDRGDGEINMQFNMGDREMSMTMSWDAVRVGDC